MIGGNTCNYFHPTWKSTFRAITTKALRIASWILVHLLPWVQRRRWIPIWWMGCVHMHKRIFVIEGYGNSNHVWNIMEKIREDNWNLKNIITNHNFSKNSTWLKCLHWPKGCALWLKTWAMKASWFFWLVFFIKMIILTKC